MFEKTFDNLQEAWANIADIDPILSEFEINPQFLQMVSPNETVVVISFNTTIGRNKWNDQYLYPSCRFGTNYP